MADTLLFWNVIYTRPRHEKKVASGLEQLQIEHYLPTAKTLVCQGRKKRYQHVPLFPSYIFARPGSAQCYVNSLHLPGVLHYVRSGKAIARVDAGIIQRLQAAGRQDHSAVHISEQQFLPGEMHQICSGPFAGLCCEIVQHHGRSKILVRIELLQRNLLLDLPADCLIPG